jgi:predicted O-linked N-acetylglucosamine transferase (SPINDLY family)
MSTQADEMLARAMQHASALYNLGQWDKTEQLCKLVLATRADHFDALILLGIIAAQTARTDEAARLLERAVLIRPEDAGVHNNLGNVLLAAGRGEDALRRYARALQINPGYAEAHNNRGNALKELDRFADALDSFQRALDIKPDFAEAHSNRGLVLYQMGRFAEALDSYDLALKMAPDFAEAHSNRGLVLYQMGRFAEALDSYERTLKIAPDFAKAYSNRGDALHALKRFEEAIASFDRALAIAPDFAAAHNNRGTVLYDLHRLNEALDSYERALKIAPDLADAYNNRGNVLHDLNRMSEAVESYDRAISLKRDYVAAYHNRGEALGRMGCLEEALESFGRALSLDPDYEWLYGAWLFTKARLCDWNNWLAERAALVTGIENGKAVARPFHALALTDSEAVQRRASEIYARQVCPPSDSLGAVPKRTSPEKIRIGYFSADFRVHPVAILSAGLFEAHDRSRFEIMAFSFGPNTQDELRRRMEQAFDRFLDVRMKSDQEIARLARQLELDIAVDLGGFTEHSRPGIFALRAAALQVGFLGFPGTMSASFIDYLVADRTVIPDSRRGNYGEKIIYMPHSYLVNDAARSLADRQFSRSDLGLPNSGFVYCCFNNSYKITPPTFDGWMRILARVDGSVLWLSEGCPAMVRNLRREATARGVSADRLAFARRMPSLAEHLSRHRAADLAIDTLPFNGHTTTADALWAGLPVLTCMGDTFAGRVAGSLLNAIDMRELITYTQEQYEEQAAELATHTQRLARIRQKLAENRLAAPLFDSRLFARHLEAAYTKIFERYRADLPAEHIYVESRSPVDRGHPDP